MNCVLPVCHSSYSLLYGTTPPEKLAQAAADYGYPGLLIADRNNLYGTIDFYQACRDRGMYPLIAVRLDTSLGPLTLIARSYEGYKNLCRLVTHYQLHDNPSKDDLDKYHRDIICCAPFNSELNQLNDIFRDLLYLQIGLENTTRAYRMAEKNDIKPMALPSVTFYNSGDFSRHRLLRAIDGGFLLKNLPASETADPGEYFHEPQWYNRFYSNFPDAVKNSKALIELCFFEFPARKNILPDFDCPGDRMHLLKQKSLSGLKRKRPDFSGKHLARLEYELSVIEHTGFIDYFLIVSDIVEFCKKSGITCVGRGSAAGSLVSYSLDITKVDPIGEDLYFERFLNEARSDCPDIDLDIDWRRRDDVLDYVYERYGHDHVAMIASYIHFQPRLAIRETAKALGLSPDEIDSFIKKLPLHPLERNDFPKPDGVLRADWERYKTVFDFARTIYGLPRHLGIHTGGIVITPEPITDYVPLERATKGLAVTQCDMYQAEKIGLVKIDILGQRGLAVIADCQKEISRLKGRPFEVPPLDKKTYETLQSGQTIGVFQIESPGLRALLKDLKPKELNDITLALALIRPGASESGMKKVFLDRFHGKEKTKYPHPSLSEILKETHGVFIYQEQVILAARKIAGFNLPASDMIRRAITKMRKKSDRTRLQKRFMRGARENGIDNATAENIFNQLGQFASFGFCKAHAATYGHLAYLSAYYKTHYPAIFMTAVLQNGGGYYPSAVYVAEARRRGCTIMPPDINLSEPEDSLKNGRIYLGIDRVRDLKYSTREQIIKHRPFKSLAHFLGQIKLSEREIENLIKVGFFDSLETSRPRLLWEYRIWGRKTDSDDDNLFGTAVIPQDIKHLPQLTPFSRYEIFKAERDILDIPASFHPLSMVSNDNTLDTNILNNMHDGQKIKTAGWLADRKRIKTREGKSMVFLTFDALSDTFEVVLFPEIYYQHSDTIRKYRYLAVEGTVNTEGETRAVIAEKIYPHPTGLTERPFI